MSTVLRRSLLILVTLILVFPRAAHASITTIQDDNNARVQWGNTAPYSANPGARWHLSGYRLTWGPLVGGQITSPEIAYTDLPAFQFQPLTPGTQYEAQIDTLSDTGAVTATQLVPFQSNSTRVTALRSQMTGFFDDFNTTAGAFNALKWNVASTACAATAYQFVNGQTHAHDQVSDGSCDRGAVVSRPRGIFDFTGRTGHITFDMDGVGRRDSWYLNLIPASTGPIDSEGHTNLDTPNTPGTPGLNMIRISQGLERVLASYFDAHGVEHQVALNNCASSLTNCNLATIKNYRRQWQVAVTPAGAGQVTLAITVDGVSLGSATLPFPETRATMQWVLFSYNTGKSNEPAVLLHWDNFGFDGPAPTVETHNYIDNVFGFEGASTDIKIPSSDPIVPGRLMYTVQMPANRTYAWRSTDSLTVNGQSYPAPDPSASNAGIVPTTYAGEQVSIPVNNLIHGDNIVSFHLTSPGTLSVHAEMDFPAGTGNYTPPESIWGFSSVPTIPDVGPDARFSSIGGDEVSGHWQTGIWSGSWSGGQSSDPANTNTGSVSHPIGPVSGTVPLWFDITAESAMQAEGKNYGIQSYAIQVDRATVYSSTLPAPVAQATERFALDTTTLCNGVHQFFVSATNTKGSPSIPDYFQGHSTQGDYFPIYVTTNNPNQPAC